MPLMTGGAHQFRQQLVGVSFLSCVGRKQTPSYAIKTTVIVISYVSVIVFHEKKPVTKSPNLL